MLAHERFQLDVIARAYERKGFTVTREYRLVGTPWRFDAVAHRVDDDALVIIELVNASRNQDERARRSSALALAAELMPHAQVAMHNIDATTSALAARLQRQRAATTEATRQTYGGTVSLPARDQDAPPNASTEFLRLWFSHATLLRALADRFADPLPDRLAEPRNILALYNDLLASGRLVAPEDVVENVDLDLFQLFDLVMMIVQGATVEASELAQPRAHLESVGEQMRADSG